MSAILRILVGVGVSSAGKPSAIAGGVLGFFCLGDTDEQETLNTFKEENLPSPFIPVRPCKSESPLFPCHPLPIYTIVDLLWLITCPSRLLFNARWMNHLMLVKTFADPSILNVPLRIHSFVLLFDLSMNDQTLGLLGSSISWEQKTTHNPNSSSPSYDPHSQQIPWIFEMIPSERKWIHQFWSWKYTIFDIRISI